MSTVVGINLPGECRKSVAHEFLAKYARCFSKSSHSERGIRFFLKSRKFTRKFARDSPVTEQSKIPKTLCGPFGKPQNDLKFSTAPYEGFLAFLFII